MKCLLEASGGPMETLVNLATNAAKSKDNTVYLKGSISNYTKDLIMTFPMLCDNSLPPSTASMLSRANERYIVTMLELLFASAQFEGKDGREVLSGIHKNINANMSMDDYIDKIDSFLIANESALEKSQINTAVRHMIRELKEEKKSFPVESFNERSVNDYSVHNILGKTIVREEVIKEYDQNDFDNLKYDLDSERLKQLQYQNAKNNNQGPDLDDAYKTSQIKRNYDQEVRDAELHPYKRNQLIGQNSGSEVEFLQKQLLDTDIKKANEMTPTLMVVRYNEIGPNGTVIDKKPFIAGVKSRLISVDSNDIVDRIIAKNKTKVNFLNFIRATTGEIKMVKDFLFCVDRAKIDAKNSVKKGEAAKMWKVLENRSTKNNLNKLKKQGNDASCVTTLVINQETVNILKKEYDFDLERLANARMVLEAYNLLGIIIADESIEVAKILYTGNDSFETQAYSYLEKESNDNSYKKVINLIGKMNGR